MAASSLFMLIPPVIWRVVGCAGHFSKRLVPSVNWYNTIPVSAEWEVGLRRFRPKRRLNYRSVWAGVRDGRGNNGTVLQGRSEEPASRRWRDVSWRRHSRRHQGAAAVRRQLYQRLSGRAGFASGRCADRCRGHPRRSRSAFRAGRQRSRGRRDARCVDPISNPRRSDVEIRRRHKCGIRRPFKFVFGRCHRRHADHRRRRLRRRCKHHTGAHTCLRDEIAGMVARPTSEFADDRQDGGARLRAVGSEQFAGNAGIAHSCLSCARQLRLQGQSSTGNFPPAPDGGAARRSCPLLPAALDLFSGTQQDRHALAGGGGLYRAAQAQRGDTGQGVAHRYFRARRHV